MAPSFVPCPECDRHVRVAERACPFCAAAMPEPVAPAATRGGTAPRALTRAAILFAGATAAAACGPGPVALYGPAPVDTGVDDAASDGASDAVGPDAVALYGPAPVDSGSDMGTNPFPDAVAAYGPAPVDSGGNG